MIYHELYLCMHDEDDAHKGKDFISENVNPRQKK